uniref:Transthyretin-like family protein n=1 Tax=Ditylenchus dipsaci TaxID=166011 RepID=A0A915DUL8_9BILA
MLLHTLQKQSIVMNSSILFVAMVLLPWLCVGNPSNPTFSDSVSTRSTRAEGILKCGHSPVVGAYVRLFKITNNDELRNVLATAQTDSSGHFTIEGDTSNYQGVEASIDPVLKFYHKCEDAEGKKGYRRFSLRYPRDYVNIGRVARRSYDIGVLNVQLKYPAESRVDAIEGLKN